MNTETSNSKAMIFATEALPTGKEASPWEKDIFDYQAYGETLGKYFENIPSLRVVLLDGDWGAGKSFFAKQWEAHMRQNEGFEIVYIDAFANDFQLDPFSLVTSAILDIEKDEGSQLREKATALLKSMTFNLMGKLSAGIVEGEQVEDLLFPKQDIVDQFKSCLEELAEKKKRLIVIIDELDRCRPDFALEMIERVKHIFDVPNVQFLLVSNRKQLAKMVSKSYGLESHEAETYLDKFFDLRVNLPRGYWPAERIYADKLFAKLFPELVNGRTSYDHVEIFIEFITRNNFTLRDIEKILSVVACVNIERFKTGGDMYLLFPLTFLRVKHADLYQRYQNDEYVWTDLVEKYGFEKWVGRVGEEAVKDKRLSSFVTTLHAMFEDNVKVEAFYAEKKQDLEWPARYFVELGWMKEGRYFTLEQKSKHQFVQQFMKEIDSHAGLFDNS